MSVLVETFELPLELVVVALEDRLKIRKLMEIREKNGKKWAFLR